MNNQLQKYTKHCLIVFFLLMGKLPLDAAKVTIHYNAKDKANVETVLFLNGYDKQTNKQVEALPIAENGKIDLSKYRDVTLTLRIQKLEWAYKGHNTRYELQLSANDVSPQIKGFKRITDWAGHKTLLVSKGETYSTDKIEIQYIYDEALLNTESKQSIAIGFNVYGKEAKEIVGTSTKNSKTYRVQIIEKEAEKEVKVEKEVKETTELLAKKEKIKERNFFESLKMAATEAQIKQAKEHLKKYPNGSYTEEVMYLLAVNSKGSKEQGELIEQYLKKYPKGRYKKEVEISLKALKEKPKTENKPTPPKEKEPKEVVIPDVPKEKEPRPVEPATTSADTKAFETAEKTNTIAAYQSYLETYENGKHYEAADTLWWALIAAAPDEEKEEMYKAYLQMLPNGVYATEATLGICQIAPLHPVVNRNEQDSTRYTIRFENNCNKERPELVYEPTSEKAIVSKNWSEDQVLDIQLSGKIELIFKTTAKTAEPISLDPGTLIFQGNIIPEGHFTLKVENIRGGVPPYSLEFMDKQGVSLYTHSIEGNSTMLNMAELVAANKIMEGKYTLRLMDQTRIETGAEIDYTVKGIEAGIQWWQMLLIAMLPVVIGGGYVFYRKYIHI